MAKTAGAELLDAGMEEVARLREAERLLECFWVVFGPYGLHTKGPDGDQLKPADRAALNRFFRFDDSE